MKKNIMIIFIILLWITNTVASDKLIIGNFSVVTPEGWIVNKEDNSTINLLMPEAKNEEISISVSFNYTTDNANQSEAWERMKPFLVKSENIKSSGLIIVGKTTWNEIKSIELICGIKLSKTILFTKVKNTTYLIQFICPENRLKEFKSTFDHFKQSFCLN